MNVSNVIDCEERIPDEPWTFYAKLSVCIICAIFINSLVTYVLYAATPNYVRELKLNEKVDDKLVESELSNKHKIIRSLARFAITNRVYVECCAPQPNFGSLTKPDPRSWVSIHYIRLFAMAITVLTHTAAMGTLQAVTKPADMAKLNNITRDLLPQFLLNPFQAIQLFFFMAGFMLTVSTLPVLRRQHKLPFIDYLMKRAIRLWPALIAAMSVNFIWPHLGKLDFLSTIDHP